MPQTGEVGCEIVAVNHKWACRSLGASVRRGVQAAFVTHRLECTPTARITLVVTRRTSGLHGRCEQHASQRTRALQARNSPGVASLRPLTREEVQRLADVLRACAQVANR